jgi:hypothetical protein
VVGIGAVIGVAPSPREAKVLPWWTTGGCGGRIKQGELASRGRSGGEQRAWRRRRVDAPGPERRHSFNFLDILFLN